MQKLLFALGIALSAPLAVAVNVDHSVVTDKELSQSILVQNVRVEGPDIVGELVNRMPTTVSDIRLLVAETFLWTDERHPNEDDDPSSAAAVTVPGPIPPDGRVTVRAPFRSRAPRPDGRFVPRMEVVGAVTHDPARPNVIPAD
jgi:hypothetical protein